MIDNRQVAWEDKYRKYDNSVLEDIKKLLDKGMNVIDACAICKFPSDYLRRILKGESIRMNTPFEGYKVPDSAFNFSNREDFEITPEIKDELVKLKAEGVGAREIQDMFPGITMNQIYKNWKPRVDRKRKK